MISSSIFDRITNLYFSFSFLRTEFVSGNGAMNIFHAPLLTLLKCIFLVATVGLLIRACFLLFSYRRSVYRIPNRLEFRNNRKLEIQISFLCPHRSTKSSFNLNFLSILCTQLLETPSSEAIILIDSPTPWKWITSFSFPLNFDLLLQISLRELVLYCGALLSLHFNHYR